MKSQFYGEKDCVVYWDDVNKWIYTDWKNQPTIATVKNGCEEMLKLLVQKKCNKILNDNTNVVGSWSAASQWVAEDWFPRIINAGLKKFAWIQSKESTLSQMSAKKAEEKNKETEIIHLFKNEADAVSWLKQ